MRQRKSKRILTLLVAIAVMLSLSTTAYAQTELQSAQPTASASASEEATQEPATAEPGAEASPSAVESAQPTATPEQSEPAKDEAQPTEPDQPSEDIEWNDMNSVKCTSSAAPLVKTQGAVKARRAMAKAKANSEEKGLIKSKTVTANDDGSYKITLEQYVTGTVSTVTTSKPVDVVLVLDVSGSMDDRFTEYTPVYNLSKNKTYYIDVDNTAKEVNHHTNSGWFDEWETGWYYYNGYNRTYVTPKTSADDTDSNHVQFYEISQGDKKIDALKKAVNNFIDEVSKDANTSGVDHQIAIVKYAGAKISKVGNDKYRGDGGYTYNYSQVVKNLTSASSAATLKGAVNDLSPAVATSADYGMQHAADIISKIHTNRDSTKVVVMFTDGEPNHDNGFDSSVASATIKEAKKIKGNGATVYTVGVMSGADDTFPMPSNASNVNKYMHYVSSNYRNATSMSNSGGAAALPAGTSYYLAANNAGKLNDVFQKISQEVTKPAIELDKTTVVKDIVTPYFTMPEKTSDIKVYTADYKGKDSSGNREFGARQDFNAEVKMDGNTISVSNFDFSGNCVKEDTAGNASGKKLIIEFTVTPKTGFLGGNNVPTNGDQSGIYNDKSSFVDKFDVPTVNVPIKDIAAAVQDKNVYLKGSVTQDEMLNGASVKAKDWKGTDVALDLTKEGFGLESWQYEFVDLGVTKPEAKSNLTDDTDFTLSASIKPKEASTTNVGTPNDTAGKSATATGKINVFKPELTFKDGEVDYLDNAPANPTDYDKNNLVSKAWKHGTTSSTDEGVKILGGEGVKILGGKPTLDLTYTPGDGITDGVITSKDTDIPVQVTVKIGEKDATEYTTFKHQACDPVCKWTEPTTGGNPAFLLHPKSTGLTIAKTVSGGEANPNEHFTFTITASSLSDRTVNATITGADGCSQGQNHGITDANLSFDENGTATVSLKHGESIKLEGLKAGEVTIAEDNGEYTLTAEVDGTKVDVNNSSIGVTLNRGDNKTAALNNKRGGTPILGIDSDNAPFIIIGAAVVICAAGFVFLRRRRGRSDF